MKKITQLFIIMIGMLGFSQQVIVQDFETPSTYNFVGFEGLGSASIQQDPEPGGTRLNTLQLVSVTNGNPWQGAEVVQQTTLLNLSTDKTVQLDVYATQAFTLRLQLEIGGQLTAAAQTYTTPNTWQTLTFNFNQPVGGTAVANGTYQKIVFFPNWNSGTNNFNSPPANFTVYVDNVRSEATAITPPGQPATAAPTPPARPAEDVRSIFSDAYTPVSQIGYTGSTNTFDTPWCGATTTLVQIEGNNTNRISGLGCEGIDFIDGRFDATDFTHFHIDIWTETPTLDRVFSFKFSNWNFGTGEANAFQYTATNANLLPNPNPGTWISLDIPLTEFMCINTPPGNACPNRTDFVQFVITSDLGTVFYDNLYLHKNTLMSVSSFDKSNIKMYPNPATTHFTVEAEDMLENVVLYNMLGQSVINVTPNNQQANIDISGLQVGVYVVKATVNGVESTTRLVKK